MSISATFAVIWIAFTVATMLAVIPIVIWAIKTRQFADQDHARYLPLRSNGPKTDRSPKRKPEDEQDALP